MTGALHHTMITVPIEKEKFRNQAAKDWETILLARAKELAPGKFSFFWFLCVIFVSEVETVSSIHVSSDKFFLIENDPRVLLLPVLNKSAWVT